jgi:hypothetical protein
MPQPRFSPGERTSGSQSLSGQRLEEKSFASDGDRTSISLDLVARHYTDWAARLTYSVNTTDNMTREE